MPEPASKKEKTSSLLDPIKESSLVEKLMVVAIVVLMGFLLFSLLGNRVISQPTPTPESQPEIPYP